MIFTIGLFISLTAVFTLLFVPVGYNITPAEAALDSVRQRIIRRLTLGWRGEMLEVIKKSKEDIIRLTLISCLSTALVIVLLGIKPLGFFIVVLAVAAAIGILFAIEFVLQNEYRQWQANLLQGIPTLINFIPAFLSVGTITLIQAIELTIPFLPEPLKSEMRSAINEIKSDGDAEEALEKLSYRAKHPLLDAISSRLLSLWVGGLTGDTEIFVDLSDQIEDEESEAVNRATTTKVVYLIAICLLGLAAGMLIYGYPAKEIFIKQISGGFGA